REIQAKLFPKKRLPCKHNVSMRPLVTPSSRSPSRRRTSGFSLVEIALAIGIIAFAFVALMSLMPAGLTTYRRALDISICTQIAQKIVTEAQQTDFDTLSDANNTIAKLPASGAPGHDYSFRMHYPGTSDVWVRYFDEQGSEIVLSNPPQLT